MQFLWNKRMRLEWLVAAALLLSAIPLGCGTSKWSDTRRTATEQLLISDAMDRAVSKLDFRVLAGKEVFLDDDAITEAVDHKYLTSSMRQHLLASGCMLKDDKTEADYIVELRVGAVGTDRHDVLYGVPAVNVPTVLPLSGIPTTFPEIPLAKRTDQRAVVKLAVFAYNRESGRLVWQSGVVPEESEAKDFWFFGAGPFQRGTIYKGMSFAGETLDIPLIPLIDLEKKQDRESKPVSVAEEAHFIEPEEEQAEGEQDKPGDQQPLPTETKAAKVKATEAKTAEPAPLPRENPPDNPIRLSEPDGLAEKPGEAFTFPALLLRSDGALEAAGIGTP